MQVIKEPNYPPTIQDMLKTENELIEIYNKKLLDNPNDKKILKKIKKCKREIKKTKILYKIIKYLFCI